MFISMEEKQAMNQASQWRTAMAEKVAPIIARNPNVQAIMLAGSTSRGNADRYSNIEIGVFWSAPPTDAERMAPIEPAGGVFWELDPYDEEHDIWMEEWGLGGVKMDVRNLTVAGMERIIADVVERCDIDTWKQNTISALQHAIPLHNAPLLERWQQQLVPYPRELGRAMVEENLGVYEWRWWAEQLISRGDWPMLYASFNEVTFQMLAVLLGLNGIYHPGFKWLHRLIEELPIAPPHLEERLTAIFRQEPAVALEASQQLVLEVYALVEQHMPEVDVAHFRAKFLRWRELFDTLPAVF